MKKYSIAVLDDYQNAALDSADLSVWSAAAHFTRSDCGTQEQPISRPATIQPKSSRVVRLRVGPDRGTTIGRFTMALVQRANKRTDVIFFRQVFLGVLGDPLTRLDVGPKLCRDKQTTTHAWGGRMTRPHGPLIG
jgi:hypothetical protein